MVLAKFLVMACYLWPLLCSCAVWKLDLLKWMLMSDYWTISTKSCNQQYTCYLQENNSRKGSFWPCKLKGKRVIVLGAGCGLAGLGKLNPIVLLKISTLKENDPCFSFRNDILMLLQVTKLRCSCCSWGISNTTSRILLHICTHDKMHVILIQYFWMLMHLPCCARLAAYIWTSLL
jgi:hypothetical protein